MSDVVPETPLDDLAEIQAQNLELRKQLIEQNAQMQAALAANRGSLLAAAGLSDDDVRRIEHPEEFADEAFAASLAKHNVAKAAPLAAAPAAAPGVTELPGATASPSATVLPVADAGDSRTEAVSSTPQPGESRESFLARVGDAFFGNQVQ